MDFFNLKNCSLGIVGKDVPFTMYDDEKIKPYLDAIEGDTRAVGHDDPKDDDMSPPPQPPVEPRPTVAMESMEH
jgi:hypothetical protein